MPGILSDRLSELLGAFKQTDLALQSILKEQMPPVYGLVAIILAIVWYLLFARLCID